MYNIATESAYAQIVRNLVQKLEGLHVQIQTLAFGQNELKL